MSKIQMLSMSAKWINLAWHYIRIGEDNKANHCLTIASRFNNQATEM